MKIMYAYIILFYSFIYGDEKFVLNYMQQKYLPSRVETFDYVVTNLGYSDQLNYDDMIYVREIKVKLFEQQENVKWYLCRLMTIGDFIEKKGAKSVYLVKVDDVEVIEVDSHETFMYVINKLNFEGNFDYKMFRELVDLFCKVFSYTPINGLDTRVSQHFMVDEFREFDDQILQWKFKENEYASFSTLNSSRRILLHFSISVREDKLSINLTGSRVFSITSPKDSGRSFSPHWGQRYATPPKGLSNLKGELGKPDNTDENQ